MTTTPETIARLRRLHAARETMAGAHEYRSAACHELPGLLDDIETLREALEAIMDDNGRHYHIDPHLAAQARAALAAAEVK
jgi:hypothetical protein